MLRGRLIGHGLPTGLRQAETLQSFKAVLRELGYFTTISYRF